MVVLSTSPSLSPPSLTKPSPLSPPSLTRPSPLARTVTHASAHWPDAAIAPREEELPPPPPPRSWPMSSSAPELPLAPADRGRLRRLEGSASVSSAQLLDAAALWHNAAWFASAAHRRDKEWALQLVTVDGHALVFCHPSLQADADVATAAVRANGLALRYAAPGMQANKAVALEAVRQAGGALFYASAELRNDADVVYAAIEQDGNALAHASLALQTDPEVRRVALRQLKHAAQQIDDLLAVGPDEPEGQPPRAAPPPAASAPARRPAGLPLDAELGLLPARPATTPAVPRSSRRRAPPSSRSRDAPPPWLRSTASMRAKDRTALWPPQKPLPVGPGNWLPRISNIRGIRGRA